MNVTRYSRTREIGARHTACTKLTDAQRDALHWLAVERGLSDYELTRRILVDYIYGASADRSPSAAPPIDRTDTGQ